MPDLAIVNARLVNEGRIVEGDCLIDGGRIVKLGPQCDTAGCQQVIDAQGRHLLPGLIDDQVHFREPGLTHKADFAHESRAAVAGGTTSVMEMPNTKPTTTDRAALTAKYARAATRMVCNHAFYFGATNDNLEEIRRLDPRSVAGVKVFMGASTGNMLVDQEATLRGIFQHAPCLIATHCEDTPTIRASEEAARERWGTAIPMREHPRIRSREACYASSSLAVELAREHDADLHVLHLSTAEELALFRAGPVAGKRITAEACVHHLTFTEHDYARLGARIKCNPAIKGVADREAIRRAVRDDVIDVIATDHAPHTWAEKQRPDYFRAPAGLPLVQHSLHLVLQLVRDGVLSLTEAVRKTSHAVAERFDVIDRGYLREGYWADLVLVDIDADTAVRRSGNLSKCGWSPFEGTTFHNTIAATLVSGQVAYLDGQVNGAIRGQRLLFDR